jgi:hypothetical protein
MKPEPDPSPKNQAQPTSKKMINNNKNTALVSVREVTSKLFRFRILNINVLLNKRTSFSLNFAHLRLVLCTLNASP